MGELVETAKVLVQPTMKLLEMCGNAIGAIYKPRHIRKMADAEAYKIKQLSDAIMESDSLPIQYENGNIAMNTVDFEDFVKRAEFRANYQLLREQQNIENVIRYTYQELEGAPDVTNDPVDENWATRLFNIVKEISTEEMQRIWSKILASEISEPGSFSMRTLDAVKNLTRDDARRFQSIAPYVLKYKDESADYFVLSNENIKDDICYIYGFSYSDLVKLEEAQLISADTNVAIYVDIQPAQRVSVEGYGFDIELGNNSDKMVCISQNAYFLTSIGAELLPIVRAECRTPGEAYFEDCRDSFLHSGKIEPEIEKGHIYIAVKAPATV